VSTQVQAALIAGVVGLATASIGALLTFLQARRERSKWLVDFKSTYTLELYRQRLAAYPAAFKIIGRLSHGRSRSPTPRSRGRSRSNSMTGYMELEACARMREREARCLASGYVAQRGQERETMVDQAIYMNGVTSRWRC
jgi:hypothetical protein